MDWSDVRTTCPDQWLVIEALQAHTAGNQRILDRITVVEVCPDSVTAMQTYRRLHQVTLDRAIPPVYNKTTANPMELVTKARAAGSLPTFRQ